MRSVRWHFERGIRLVGKPGPGEARFIQDAIVEQGRLRPIALPDHQPQVDVTLSPPATTIWKRRNMQRVSSLRRRYAVCSVPGQEILCFTEQGAYPQKEVAGNLYPLGIPQPKYQIQKSSKAYESRYSLTIRDGGVYGWGQTVFYRFIMKGPMGYLPPTEVVSVTMPANPKGSTAAPNIRAALQTWHDVSLGIDWSPDNQGDIGAFKVDMVLPRPLRFQGYTGCMIFAGSTKDNLCLIGELAPNVATFMDTGQLAKGPSITSYISSQVTEAIYTHCYVFQDGGYTTEGAPAPPSASMGIGDGTLLSFDPLLDGFWEQPGLQTLNLTMAASILGPATQGETSYTSTPLGTSFTDIHAFGLAYNLTGSLNHPDGMGLATLLTASPHVSQEATTYRSTIGTSTGWGKGDYDGTKIVFPELCGASSIGFDQVADIAGGFIMAWAYDSVYGAIRVNFNQHGLRTGEKILIYKPAAGPAYTITNQAVVEFVRDNTNPGWGWLIGDMGWTWQTGEVIRWARNLLYLPLNAAGAATPTQDLIPAGTFVRITNGTLGTIFAVAYPSPQGLFLDGDWAGFEYLGSGTNTLASPITLDFYPRNAGIVSRRIFRQDTGSFLQVDDIPIWQTEYADARTVDTLGPAMTGEFLDESGSPVLATPPPPDLTNLTPFGNMLLGISGGVVRGSLPGRPDAWPAQYYWKPGDVPVGIFPWDGAIIVGCRNSVERIDGSVPAFMQIRKTMCEDGLLAPYSFQGTPHGLIFLGTRGICITNGQTSECLTEDRVKVWELFSRRQDPGDGSAMLPGLTTLGHVMDTTKGTASNWVATTEDAAALGAMAKDATLNLVRTANHQDWESIGSAYHRGRYYLYMRSNLELEGCGSWVLDLNSNPSQLLHLGLSPLDTWVDGDDFWLLLNADM